MRVRFGAIGMCLIVGIASTLLCGGCVTMGLYAAGKAIADRNLKDVPAPRCGNTGIRLGERIDLTLKDGQHVKGYFRGLDCASDSAVILGSSFVGTSWDVAFGDADTERIPLSEIHSTRAPTHSYERPALVVGIFADIVLISWLIAWARGMEGIGS